MPEGEQRDKEGKTTAMPGTQARSSARKKRGAAAQAAPDEPTVDDAPTISGAGSSTRTGGSHAAGRVEDAGAPPALDPVDADRLVHGRHHDPHSVLGRHGGVVRALRPEADEMYILQTESGSDQQIVSRTPMRQVAPNLWEGALDRAAAGYRLEALYGEQGAPSFVFDDPYRFWPTLGDLDLHLFNEGRHRRLWEVLGAHTRAHQGVAGTAFAVWAPNAKAVRVVGDWNFWDGRTHPMRVLGSSGVWELFIPAAEPGARYKYEIITSDDRLVLKADPFARATEVPPGTASVIAAQSRHVWSDRPWMEKRAEGDPLAKPMSVYEVHLGSWRWTDDGQGGQRPLTYLELADQLPQYCSEMGFTHVEFLPVAEHPFGGSWGYQVSAYYAPTARYGGPDEFRALVDALHRAGIGVIADWVPAHFPRDEFALAHFDGTALYEHSGPMGAHPDWGTLVFNLGRHEVRNFLMANALFWLDEYHVDALRVDAVASMLYLDYSRKAGEWQPNEFGGNENLQAVSFLKELNETIFGSCAGATMIAEESTSWPGVSRPTYLGGLGFGYKWNMGWMHDTLQYFEVDPLFRRYRQNDLTFGLLYAFYENFILPLSHDEVVHGKGSMLAKMPGDRWRQLANLRALYAWMWAHPGKKLLFMGGELGEEREWSNERPLDWWMLDQWADHERLRRLVAELNRIYRAEPALWEQDFVPDGFRWIDASDANHNVLSFYRRRRRLSGANAGEASWPPVPVGDLVVCIANLSPVPQLGYRVGLPRLGRWLELLNTDAREWGGSGIGNAGEVWAEDVGWHGQPHSAEMVLPPLAVLWFAPAG
ncbi:MAG TPA: 1,4-alpha-glucan branching protein GlgB [Acidimicrobiales bacterium]|nr:1,4-alpha-glucan branching protein GlgB [Acidimicrobiales bacterium]